MDKEIEGLLINRGFLNCQYQLSEAILRRHKEILAEMKALSQKLNGVESGIKRHQILYDLAKLSGQADSLAWLNRAISSFSPPLARNSQ